MTRISAFYPSSVLSPSFISYTRIHGSNPRVLSPGGCLPLGLDFEAFTRFRLMVFDILYFSTQVDFQNGRVAVILLCHT